MDTTKDLQKGLSTLNLEAPPSHPKTPPSFSPSVYPVLEPAKFINVQAYRLPSSTLSADHVVVTTTHPSLCTNQLDLWHTIGEQMELPPRPTVRILGQHSENGFPSELDTIDFDLTLDVMGLLSDGVSRSLALVNRGFSDHEWKNIIEDPMASLAGSVEAFCEGVSGSRSFTVTRSVSNWDTAELECLIRTTIATTNYQGVVTITFPITFSKVIIRTARPAIDDAHSRSKWVNKSGITKSCRPDPNEEDPSATRFGGLKCVWPFASAPAGADGRRCAVQSEKSGGISGRIR